MLRYDFTNPVCAYVYRGIALKNILHSSVIIWQKNTGISSRALARNLLKRRQQLI